MAASRFTPAFAGKGKRWCLTPDWIGKGSKQRISFGTDSQMKVKSSSLKSSSVAENTIRTAHCGRIRHQNHSAYRRQQRRQRGRVPTDDCKSRSRAEVPGRFQKDGYLTPEEIQQLSRQPIAAQAARLRANVDVVWNETK